MIFQKAIIFDNDYITWKEIEQKRRDFNFYNFSEI
jgi:hypothetical protein